MVQEELIKVFKYIVKKCDMLINNGDYKADDYTQDTVEDIAELCNHILDEDCGKLVEVKEENLEKEIKEVQRNYKTIEEYEGYPCTMYANNIEWIAKHFFELGLKALQKGEKV